mmetsp:Transcript_62913/g.124375  ORF Transcript_62913/g.124375 Transcript_62913/m.124375 type:complete len:209 (+) Transcript_62913:381-1007(+)
MAQCWSLSGNGVDAAGAAFPCQLVPPPNLLVQSHSHGLRQTDGTPSACKTVLLPARRTGKHQKRRPVSWPASSVHSSCTCQGRIHGARLARQLSRRIASPLSLLQPRSRKKCSSPWRPAVTASNQIFLLRKNRRQMRCERGHVPVALGLRALHQQLNYARRHCGSAPHLLWLPPWPVCSNAKHQCSPPNCCCWVKLWKQPHWSRPQWR